MDIPAEPAGSSVNSKKRRFAGGDESANEPLQKVPYIASEENKSPIELIALNDHVLRTICENLDDPSLDSLSKTCKRLRETVTRNKLSSVQLLDLSDEILLEVFQHLDSPSIYNLSKTSIWLNSFVRDKNLWTHFDFSAQPLSTSQIQERMSFLTKQTVSFSVRGLLRKYPLDCWKSNTLTKNMLQRLAKKCPNLERMYIFEGVIHQSQLSIVNFPVSLTSLTFEKSVVEMIQSPSIFFRRIDEHLCLLEELALIDCHWFDTHDLVCFSKLPHLRVLNLRGSPIKECVAYASIATRFGFRKLEVLNVTNTAISDSDIQCFNTIPKLRELLLSCPAHLKHGMPESGTRELSQAELAQRETNDKTLPPTHETSYVIVQLLAPTDRPPWRHGGDGIDIEGIAPNEHIEPLLRGPISDIGICSFGIPCANAIQGIVWIRSELRSPITLLERLTVCHYKRVTDRSLIHLVSCSPNLKWLDIRGTSVTSEGVLMFQTAKPNCTVLSNYNDNESKEET